MRPLLINAIRGQLSVMSDYQKRGLKPASILKALEKIEAQIKGEQK